MTAVGPVQSPSAEGERPQEIRLYEKWRKIYPLWVKGRFMGMRRVVLVLLLLVFYVSPWLTFKGQPLVWFDLPGRKFILLGTTYWPQELVLLSWLLMIAAFSLFLVTVIAGRVWCGWACPQTVWTFCYVWIEKLVEGDRTQRMRLDRGPWNAQRVRAKAVKWTLWGLLSFSISFTFVSYFVPARVLVGEIATLDLRSWEQFWLAFPAVLSFLFSGVLREQVCFHMCPYARFQSVMFDRDTLIISYNEERGEPRGSRPRHADPAALGMGSCVDCKLCVHACPTGIDIRDGLQYQCIACAACVDVCDDVMDRLGYARGLIRYSSEHRDKHESISLLRPRLAGYAAVLTALVLAFTWTVSHRVPLELDIIRDRNRLYREYWDGSVENVYSLRIMNREQIERTYRIRAESDGAQELELKTRGDSEEVSVAAGTQLTLPVQLVARATAGDATDQQANVPIAFTIETIDEPHFSVTEASRFLRPAEPN